jgi:hypothetical protein
MARAIGVSFTILRLRLGMGTRMYHTFFAATLFDAGQAARIEHRYAIVLIRESTVSFLPSSKCLLTQAVFMGNLEWIKLYRAVLKESDPQKRLAQNRRGRASHETSTTKRSGGGGFRPEAQHI